MPPTSDPTVAWAWTLFNLGVLGVVFWMVATGRLITPGHADEIRAGRTEAISGWKAQTDATKELTGVVREQAGTIERLKANVEELLRREPHRRGGP